jgi:two-component system sensor histidine kinase VanS
MSRSIFAKLFAITAVVFSLFIGGMLIIQSAFFQQYYLHKKTQAIHENMSALNKIYAEADDVLSQEAALRAAELSGRTGSAFFFIRDMEASDASSTVTSVTIGAFTSTSATLNTEFYEKQIKRIEKLYRENKKAMDNGKIISYNAEDEYGQIAVVAFSSVVSKGVPVGLLYSFTSLQPVGEAAAVIQDYYLLIFGAALLMILFLSWLYSRQISRPLVQMNRVAEKIACMDFSEACTVQSRDELGNLSRTINFLSDNLSQSIHELKEINQRLENELEKQKELEAMRKDFIAAASHELKTPVSVIRGYIEGLQDSLDKGEINKDYLDIVKNETDRMGSLVNGLLDLSQLESGKASLSLEAVSLARLTRYVLKKLSYKTEAKHLEIRNQLTDDLMVMADGSRIEQVLTNIMTNAIRHTPEGGWISLRAAPCRDGIRMAIENSGSSIPQEDLSRVWEKFYRIEKSRNRESGGTGLGLSIVRQILELHGSRYGAENTSSGVLFYFTMPYVTQSNTSI